MNEKVDGRRARREVTREAILTHAVAIFADKGFAATGVDEIANAAGVSKGTVFYSFSSKDGLFDAVVEQVLGRLQQALTIARADLRGRRALEAQTWAVMECVAAQVAIGRLLVREIFGGDGNASRAAARRALLAPLVTSLRELRTEVRTEVAGDSGDQVETADDEVLAVGLLCALVGATLDREIYTPGKELAQVHSHFMTVLATLGGA